MILAHKEEVNGQMYHARTRWIPYVSEEAKIKQMTEVLGISPLLAKMLIHREIAEPDLARRFLQPSLEHLHDPFLLEDMEKAVERIHDALQENEKIVIYGDYDADGVSSTSLMMKAFRYLEADVDYYIPNRFREGYGLNKEAILRLKEQGAGLVISVDTGISAVEEAALAKEIGLDLIITDHHEPPAILPDAFAVINPKKPTCPYPFKQLAGVGVAFKLISAILDYPPVEWMDLVALGTIADLVPLSGENRVLATYGLKRMNERANVGLSALADAAGVGKEINASAVGFFIGPRINASGRLYSANEAVDLLLTENQAEAIQIAEKLNERNRERQELVEEMTEQAIAQVEQNPAKHRKVIIVAQEGWNVGVVGIVASRLVEKYYRPTIVLGIDPEKGVAKGSARSIVGFDLYQALTASKEYLPHYGGHTMAAGMTMPIENLEPLHQRLSAYAEETLSEEDYVPLTRIEGKLDLSEVQFGILEEIRQMEPFGTGNPTPLFQIDQAILTRLQKMGQSQNHLKLHLTQEEKNLEVVAFRRADIADQLTQQTPVQVVGELTMNEWNGRRTAQVLLKDLRIAERQIFDWRSNRKWEKVQGLAGEKCLYILRAGTSIPQQWRQANESSITYWDQLDRVEQFHPYLVFIDPPPTMKQYHECIERYTDAERYYFLFSDADDANSLVNVPRRDQFKKLYQTLYQVRDKNVQFPRHLDSLSRKTGLSKRALSFMIQVFEDLSFVSIEQGRVQIQAGTGKRPLEESVLYQRQVEYAEVQQYLVYSSYRDLRQYLETKPWQMAGGK